MSKYIIELEDDIQYLIINGRADNRCYTLVRPVTELEILNSDYINEHYGELQDEAYKRGYEDGKESTKNGCMGCKYETRTSCEEPCKYCSNCHTSKYTPMPEKKDRIEVGDEVTTETGKKYTVVSFGAGGTVCGFNTEGKWTGWKPKEVTKTGKHYDIQSILEAMRNTH